MPRKPLPDHPAFDPRHQKITAAVDAMAGKDPIHEALDLPRGELARAERRAFLGVFSRKSRWPELDHLDQRCRQLQQRHDEAVARLGSLKDQRHLAPERDAQAMAEWIAGGQKGPAPPDTAAELDDAIRDAERQEAGAQLAYDQALEERAAYVEQNRTHLVNVAAQQVAREHKRYVQLVDELEQSRARLLELRQDELWARFFPGPEATLSPHNQDQLVGALAKPVERALQIGSVRLAATGIFKVLRADADWLRDAAAPQQRDLLAGRRPGEREDINARWGNPSPEELRREREGRRRYADLYGP